MASPKVPANTLSPALSTGIPNIFDRFAPRATKSSASASKRSTVLGPAFGILGVLGGAFFAAGFLAGDRSVGDMEAMVSRRAFEIDIARPQDAGYRHAVAERFEADMRAGYPVGLPGLTLGSPVKDEVLTDVRVRLPLSTVNRHGPRGRRHRHLGKTKTLQVIAGQLSDAGVPVFVAEMKGDLSGLAQPIDASDPKIADVGFRSQCAMAAGQFSRRTVEPIGRLDAVRPHHHP